MSRPIYSVTSLDPMKLLRLSLSLVLALTLFSVQPARAQESAPELLIKAEAASAERDFETSAALFLKAAETAPEDNQVAFRAGLGLIAAERWQEASVLLRRGSQPGSTSETWARIWFFILHRLNLAETNEKQADGRPFSASGDFRAYVKSLKDDKSFAADAARYVLGPKRNEDLLSSAEAHKQALSAAGESSDWVDGMTYAMIGARCEMTKLIQWAGENYRRSMSASQPGSAPFELSRSCFARIARRMVLTPSPFFRLEQEDRDGTLVCVARAESEENLAYTMGLRTGERVLSLEGLPEACEVATEVLGSLVAGDVVTLEVERDGATVKQWIVIDVASFRPGQRR